MEWQEENCIRGIVFVDLEKTFDCILRKVAW